MRKGGFMHLLIEPVLYNSSTLSIRNYRYYNNNTIYYKQQYGETPIECVESREAVPRGNIILSRHHLDIRSVLKELTTKNSFFYGWSFHRVSWHKIITSLFLTKDQNLDKQTFEHWKQNSFSRLK
jgi:hypothetical protein